ncbi:MAG: hypothetical protein KDA83_03715 [Planctomycetales bacterium]|nr:hypothetical protein [Planctomycetales bacterium]
MFVATHWNRWTAYLPCLGVAMLGGLALFSSGCGGELAEPPDASPQSVSSAPPIGGSMNFPTPRQVVPSSQGGTPATTANNTRSGADPFAAMFQGQLEPPIAYIATATRSSRGVAIEDSAEPAVHESARKVAEARAAFRTRLCDWSSNGQGRTARTQDEDVWVREVLTKEIMGGFGRSWSDIDSDGQALAPSSDPLVLYSLGLAALSCDRFRDAFDRFKESAEGFQNSDYPALAGVLVHRRIEQLLSASFNDRSVQHRGLANYNAAVQHWVFNDFVVPKNDIRFAYEEVREYLDAFEHSMMAWKAEPFSRMGPLSDAMSPYKLATQLRIKLAPSTAHPAWFVNMVCGHFHLQNAWVLRGHDLASQVNPNLMAQAETEARTAYDFFLIARNADDSLPESAEGLTSSCGFLGAMGEFHHWFGESTHAQPDYLKAYQVFFNYLSPQWHDDPRAIVAQLEQVAELSDYSSGVQVAYLSALMTVQIQTGEDLLQQATVQPFVRQTLEETLRLLENGGGVFGASAAELGEVMKALGQFYQDEELKLLICRVGIAAGDPAAAARSERTSFGWDHAMLGKLMQESPNPGVLGCLAALTRDRAATDAQHESVEEFAASRPEAEQRVLLDLVATSQTLGQFLRAGEIKDARPSDMRWIMTSNDASLTRFNDDGSLTLVAGPGRNGNVSLQLPPLESYELKLTLRFDQTLGDVVCAGLAFSNPMLNPMYASAGITSSGGSLSGDFGPRYYPRSATDFDLAAPHELRVLRTGNCYWIWVDGRFAGGWNKYQSTLDVAWMLVAGLRQKGLGNVTIESIGIREWEGGAIPFFLPSDDGQEFFQAYLQDYPGDVAITAFHAIDLAHDGDVDEAEELLAMLSPPANDSFASDWLAVARGYCRECAGDWQGALAIYESLIDARSSSDPPASFVPAAYRARIDFGSWEHALIRHTWIRLVNAPQASAKDYEQLESRMFQFIRHEYLSSRLKLAIAAAKGGQQVDDVNLGYAERGWGESASESQQQAAAFRAGNRFQIDAPLSYEWLNVGTGTVKPWEPEDPRQPIGLPGF